MKSQLISFLFLALIHSIFTLQYSSCDDSDSSKPISVTVTKCNDDEKCQIKRGSDLRLEIEFHAASSANELNPVIKWKTYTSDLPSPLLNGCKNLIQGGCPLNEGEYGKYSVNLPILQDWLPWDYEVQIYLINENEEVVTCAKGVVELI